VGNIEFAMRQSTVAPEVLGRRFDSLCLQTGHVLTLEAGGVRTRGECLGIAQDGALLLNVAGAAKSFYSGVLVHK
jgi:hypothetical protein